MLKNWKTTMVAVSVALAEVAKLLQGEPFSWDLIVAGLLAIGMLFAADSGTKQ